DADTTVRIEAIEAVVAWEAARQEEARTWLSDDDPRIVEHGIRAMDWQRPEAATAIPALITMLANDPSSRNPRHRSYYFLSALTAQKSAARPAIPYLLRMLESTDENYKPPNIDALVELGADQKDLVRLLRPFLNDKSQKTWASGRLARVSPEEARRQVSRLIP